MVTGPTPENTDRLTTGPLGSLNKPVIEEPPAPLMLLFLPWSMPPGHSSLNELLNTFVNVSKTQALYATFTEQLQV